ncbi:MAG TPA: hypothetical protein VK106_04395 [Balneolaceae bacterium]|nr:hypothetical protein [Balneolaceae bacterium]
MTYPIFNSFVNQIENEVSNKNINIKTFKTWHEDRINATGLEILTDVKRANNTIKEIAINFDWDRFREITLATQLKGLNEHPMLQDENIAGIEVEPKIDVEVSWIFNEQHAQIALHDEPENKRLKRVRNWMQAINKQLNELYNKKDIITRWHIELEGNGNKYISTLSLISYFQYSFAHLNSLNEAHHYISKQLKELLLILKQVHNLSDSAIKSAA